jgi:hypothetical protein
MPEIAHSAPNRTHIVYIKWDWGPPLRDPRLLAFVLQWHILVSLGEGLEVPYQPTRAGQYRAGNYVCCGKKRWWVHTSEVVE